MPLLFPFHVTLCTVYNWLCFLALVLYLAFPPHHTPSFNKAGLLDWVHTCHLASHVAGWVGPLPHLSSYIPRVWHTPHSLAHPLLYRVCCCQPCYISQGVLLPPLVCHFAGCVAATLSTTLQGVSLPPLLSLFAGCVAATLVYSRVHPTTFGPSFLCHT